MFRIPEKTGRLAPPAHLFRTLFVFIMSAALSNGCTVINRNIPLQKPPAGVSKQGFVRPISGVVTSTFGQRTFKGKKDNHRGIDFVGNWMITPVFAAKEGTVTVTSLSKDYGLWIEIKHPDNYVTRYCHLSWQHAVKGAKVLRGDLIGRVGNSGKSTGSHLHFEVRLNGVPVDPRTVLPP